MLELNFNPFPVLTTQRLVLRKFEEGDDQQLFEMRSDERIMQFIGRPRAKTVDDARELINKFNKGLVDDKAITWAIALKEDNRLVGTIGYWRILKEHYRAEIGYLLHHGFHGKGMMQEALTKVIDYGFNNMQLHTIEGQVNPGNTASIRLLEKNNFIKEGHFRENFCFEGRFTDTVVYTLFNSKSASRSAHS